MEDKRFVDFFLQKKGILCAILITIVGVCGLAVSGILISVENKKTHSFKQNVIVKMENQPSSLETPLKQEACTIEMKVPLRSDGLLNCWYQNEGNIWGSQYDIYIKNNTEDCKLKEWVLKFLLPEGSRIDSSWNGFYVKRDQEITVTPSKEAFNDEINAYGFAKIGFVLYSDEILKDCNFEFTTILEKSFLHSRPFLVFMIVTIAGLLLFIFTVINYIILSKQQKQSDKQLSDVLKLCASFIDTRDSYTKMHSSNVAKYSKMLAASLGYSEKFQKNIYSIGLLHDIGKVLIPTSILCKPARLNDEEFAEMKKHTVYGAEVLRDFNGIEHLKEGVLYHHERYDGKGYMSGLAGNDIPLEARIVCVADSFDAMATDRAYRPHLPKSVIVAELEKGKGSQFDPQIAQAMLTLIEKGCITV